MLWPHIVSEFSGSNYGSIGQWTFCSLLSSGDCSADTVCHAWVNAIPKQNACTNSQVLGLLDALIYISLFHYGKSIFPVKQCFSNYFWAVDPFFFWHR